MIPLPFVPHTTVIVSKLLPNLDILDNILGQKMPLSCPIKAKTARYVFYSGKNMLITQHIQFSILNVKACVNIVRSSAIWTYWT